MSNITQQQVLKALAYVDDPDLKRDLVSLNMVEDIRIDGKKIGFKLVLTTPACPLKEEIKNACITAIKHFVDKEAQVEVEITSRVSTRRNANEQLLPGVKNIIVVASGKGGVGKSTVAVNLAVGLAKKGAKVGLIDADIHGPSIPIMMGLQGERPQVSDPGDGSKPLMVPSEKFGVKTLSIGFLSKPEQAIVWRGPMVSSALRQFVGDTLWGELDYMIMDLPPGTGDVHLTLVQTVPVTAAVVVTSPQAVAQADVVKAISMFQMPQINVPILGIVENMSYFAPPELPGKKYYLFGKGGGELLAKKYGLPLLGQIPITEQASEAGDNGMPAVLQDGTPLAAAFDELVSLTARNVAIRNNELAPTKRVEVG